jgi:hypothetical protein
MLVYVSANGNSSMVYVSKARWRRGWDELLVKVISARFSARWVCRARVGSLDNILPRSARSSSVQEMANRGVRIGWTRDVLENMFFASFPAFPFDRLDVRLRG